MVWEMRSGVCVWCGEDQKERMIRYTALYVRVAEHSGIFWIMGLE